MSLHLRHPVKTYLMHIKKSRILAVHQHLKDMPPKFVNCIKMVKNGLTLANYKCYGVDTTIYRPVTYSHTFREYIFYFFFGVAVAPVFISAFSPFLSPVHLQSQCAMYCGIRMLPLQWVLPSVLPCLIRNIGQNCILYSHCRLFMEQKAPNGQCQ